MTKDELMQLADAYSDSPHLREALRANRKALSDAIDAALALARNQALEEVLALSQIKGNLFAEKAIRALAEVEKSNDSNRME